LNILFLDDELIAKFQKLLKLEDFALFRKILALATKITKQNIQKSTFLTSEPFGPVSRKYLVCIMQ
jgi:hypothetical protein